MSELTGIDGLGPAKVDKLAKIGITDLRSLAEMDLRKKYDIGISAEVLKKSKRQARRILEKQGEGFVKAAYGEKPKFKRQSARASAANGGTKKGILARLFSKK